MADLLKPTDFPEGSKVELFVLNGQFHAFFYDDETSRVYDGEGSADTIDDAVREALADAE